MPKTQTKEELELEGKVPSVAEATGEPVIAEDETRFEVKMIADQGRDMNPGDLVEVGHTRANRWTRDHIAEIVRKAPPKPKKK